MPASLAEHERSDLGTGTGDGAAAVLACFDDTAAGVFAVHARLTAGDRKLTTSLLVDTFAELAADPSADSRDRRAMVDRAHRTFLSTGTRVTVAPGHAG